MCKLCIGKNQNSSIQSEKCWFHLTIAARRNDTEYLHLPISSLECHNNILILEHGDHQPVWPVSMHHRCLYQWIQIQHLWWPPELGEIYHLVSNKPTVWGPATCCWSPGRNAHLWTKTRSEMWTTGTSWWQMHHQMPPPPSTHTILNPLFTACISLKFSVLASCKKLMLRWSVYMFGWRQHGASREQNKYRHGGVVSTDLEKVQAPFVTSQRAQVPLWCHWGHISIVRTNGARHRMAFTFLLCSDSQTF